MYLNTPGVEWIHTTEATIVASVFAAVSILISVIHILQHLSHYTMPQIQLYVIRILIICPVYALSSALAVGLGKNGQYAEVARDVYEAFVIYSFLNLIMEYCGGETDCIYQIENEPMLKMPCPLCFMKPRQRDARLIRSMKRGCLQFVIIKPIFAVIDIIMIATGQYYLLPYQFFEMFVYNISYTWALYCMYIFYLATNKIIGKFRPVLKFASVKLIVFATYYQSLFVKASSMSPENAIMWNDLLLCVEMVVFSSVLMLAFPTSEFQGGLPDSRLMDNVKDVLKIKDVVQDVYHNFMPVYQEYTLQRSEKEAPETVRVKTYLAGNLDSVAIEMSHRYRGRNKRFAFNSLLRGDTPIRAQLRSRSGMFNEKKGDNDCDSESRSSTPTSANELVVEKSVAGIVYEELGIERSESRLALDNAEARELKSYDLNACSTEDDLDRSTDCLNKDNIRHRDFFFGKNDELDLEANKKWVKLRGSSEPNVIKQNLNPIELDICKRRVNFMKTHGIGLVVTRKGVEIRPSDFCPTEEESVLNVDFMKTHGEEMEFYNKVISPLYDLPSENAAAAVLPRITSSKMKDKKAKEHEKLAREAVRCEALKFQSSSISESHFCGSKYTIATNETLFSSSENFKRLNNVTKDLKGNAKPNMNQSDATVVTSSTDDRSDDSKVESQVFEKYKSLPPIVAISGPPKCLYASKSRSKLKNDENNNSAQDIADEIASCKDKRGASEESEDWGEFQSIDACADEIENGVLEESSATHENSESNVSDCDDGAAEITSSNNVSADEVKDDSLKD